MKTITIITGASSGIGREMVRLAAAAPDCGQIWAIGRNQEALAQLKHIYGKRVLPVALDLTCAGDMDRLERRLKQTDPRIRLLINSAGCGKAGTFMDYSDQQQRKEQQNMIRLNVQAMIEMTQLCLPRMIPGSRIINLASGSAFLPQPGFAVYAASKAAVFSFSRAVNAELKPYGICVTAVCPGPVDTPFFQHTGRPVSPFKRNFMETPEKVAKKAWRASERHREVCLTSPAMHLVRAASHAIPHRLILRGYSCINKEN